VIRLPGIIGALPMSRHVVGMLGGAGLELTIKTDFNPYRKAIPKFRSLSNEEKNRLIAKDQRYGRVICRCETVTEGEIAEAIRRGAKTLDGVKFRTRASMGRCQGNFCGPKIADILAREFGHSLQSITKKGENSNYAYAIGMA
jgi:glycerol-3-phosphate dehydrogenase